MAAPVFLEGQKARSFGVDVGIDVVPLLPQGVGRVEVLEVLHQPGAVELARAQVAGQRGQPAATGEAAAVAHRVLAAPAGPVRQRRAGQDDGAEQLGPDGGGHHDLPAGLAVADHGRLAVGIGVQLDHLAQKGRLGAHHVLHGLPRHRVGREADEVARMPGGQRGADFAVGLEAADARAVAGARIDDDEGALGGVGGHAGCGLYAHQPVIDRARQRVAAHHQRGRKVQHVGRGFLHVGAVLVAALTHDVGIQDAALPRVTDVVDGLLGHGPEIEHESPPVGSSAQLEHAASFDYVRAPRRRALDHRRLAEGARCSGFAVFVHHGTPG